MTNDKNSLQKKVNYSKCQQRKGRNLARNERKTAKFFAAPQCEKSLVVFSLGSFSRMGKPHSTTYGGVERTSVKKPFWINNESNVMI